MYILVRDDIPLGFAMVAVAHASLAGYLKFKDEPEVAQWLSGPFFKAVCKVNAREFENAKQVPDHVVLTQPGVQFDSLKLSVVRFHIAVGLPGVPAHVPYIDVWSTRA